MAAPVAEHEGDAPRAQRPRAAEVALKTLFGLAGLFLFVLALQVLKEAAGALGGFVTETLDVDSPLSALGFGWVFAYVVLSGSPVAAIALTFFSAGIIDAIQTFTMIAGSRFGASFIVLFIGFLYMLRGRPRGQSLEMGVLSLLTTYAVYAVAVPLGVVALMSGVFDDVHPRLPSLLLDVVEVVFGPIVALLDQYLPGFFLFLVGMAFILAAFSLFDHALPDLSKESPVRGLEAHVYRPMLMFALGGVLTLFTLSVSVSLGLLVPLSAKGIARRENVIPYIMGANITTFVDTLFATFFLGKPEAFTIVLVEMSAVLAVSVAILAFGYARFERALLNLSRLVLTSKAYLAAFLLVVLVLPLVLIVL